MKLFLAALALTIAAPVSAEPTSKQVLCYDLHTVTKILKEDYKESVTFTDRNTMSRGSWIALAENAETGTWTVFEYDKTTACILGMGQRTPAQRL